MKFRIKKELDWNARVQYILQKRFLFFFWVDAWEFKHWVFLDKQMAYKICDNMNKKVNYK